MSAKDFVRRLRAPRLRSVASLALGLAIYIVWPAQALARAVLRFVHAVPGAGVATVEITEGGQPVRVGAIGFGQSTAFHSIRSGKFLWRLLGGGGRTLAKGSGTVGDGTYTGVFLLEKQGVSLGLYRDRTGEPGTSLIRVIHAAPELGSPELELDGQVVLKELGFTQATPYLNVNPGAHSLAAMRPGDTTPVLKVNDVKLVNDVAYTAIVIGSRGQMVRVVTVTDSGAPLTRPAPARKTRVTQASPATTTSEPSSVTVHPGDSLWRIASERLGPGASNSAIWREAMTIWDANVSRIGTGDPNLIFPGQRLQIPAA